MRVKRNVRVYKAMTYEAEIWPVQMTQENKMGVAEIRTLRWILGYTKMLGVSLEEVTVVRVCHEEGQQIRG